MTENPAALPPVRVAGVDDLAEGDTLVVPAATAGTSDDICLVRDDDGRYWALDDTCSHEDASLAEGWVEDGALECPLHATQFELCSGRPLCLPATRPVATHRVELRGDEVWLHPGVPAQ